MARRSSLSGWADFAQNFSTMYELGNKFAQDIEVSRAMKEQPEEYYDSQEAPDAAQRRGLGIGAAPAVSIPKWKYGGKTFDAAPDEDQLRELRYRRLGDIYTKYGQADKALEMDKNLASLQSARRTNRIGDATEATDIAAGLVKPKQAEATLDATQAGTEGTRASTNRTVTLLPEELRGLSGRNDLTAMDIEMRNELDPLKVSAQQLSNDTVKQAYDFNAGTEGNRKTLLREEALKATLGNEYTQATQGTSIEAANKQNEALAAAKQMEYQRSKAFLGWSKDAMEGKFENNDAAAAAFWERIAPTVPPEVLGEMKNKYDNNEIVQITNDTVKYGAEINKLIETGDDKALETYIERVNGDDLDVKMETKNGVTTMTEYDKKGNVVWKVEGEAGSDFHNELKAKLSPAFFLEYAKHKADLRLKGSQSNAHDATLLTKGTEKYSKALLEAQKRADDIRSASAKGERDAPTSPEELQAELVSIALRFGISPADLGADVKITKADETTAPAPPTSGGLAPTPKPAQSGSGEGALYDWLHGEGPAGGLGGKREKQLVRLYTTELAGLHPVQQLDKLKEVAGKWRLTPEEAQELSGRIMSQMPRGM